MLPDLKLRQLDLTAVPAHEFESPNNYRLTSEEEWQAINILQNKIALHDPAGLPMINKAVKKALEAHFGQFRETGEPFSMHLMFPAIWAADLRVEKHTIAGILLHDTHEDTEYHLKQIRHDFGRKVPRIVDAVTQITGTRTTFSDTAYKLLDALTSTPEAVIVRALEQLYNAMTLDVKDPKTIDKTWRRTIEFTAPLAKAFGLEPVARQLVYHSTFTRFKEQAEKIISFINENNPYSDEDINAITETVRDTIEVNGDEIIPELPNLYDLIQSTQYGRKIDKQEMIIKYDLVYGKNLNDAYADFFSRLSFRFGNPRKKTSGEKINSEGDLQADGYDSTENADTDWIGDFKKNERIEFIHTINGREVHFRLISKKDHQFEKTSLLPLFQHDPQVPESEIGEAREKLKSWQNAWKRKKRQQNKRISVEEFIRFLEGEKSIIVRTKETPKFPQGEVYELPRGSTIYDLVAGLRIPRTTAREILTHLSKVTYRDNGSEKELIPYYDPLPNDKRISFETNMEKVSLIADMLDYVYTEDGIADMRVALEALMRKKDIGQAKKKEIIIRGKRVLTNLYKAEARQPRLNIPIEKMAPRYADYFQVDYSILTSLKPETAKVKKEELDEEFITKVLIEFGLKRNPDFLNDFIKAMKKYRQAILPISITTINRTGLDEKVASIFRSLGLDVVDKEIEFGDRVTIITYIGPEYKSRQADIQLTIDMFKKTWEQA